ncbi:hypothetical protein DXV76_11810 [Rhodobacteraceae bacterium CCMM004]|nr:hypothetical protein DXV76_11810 [Rhodobacteraceae bacterium CCMM004]
MTSLFVLILAVAFAASPLLVPDFGGFDPEQYPVPQTDPPVQPAGYAFSIWGPIYLWLIAHGIYGVWKRRDDPDWEPMRTPLIGSLAVGTVWLAVAVASPIWATVLIWVMLVAAAGAYLRAPERDRWWAEAPVGLYAGWLTAASSVSVGLVLAGWGVVDARTAAWIGLVIALILATAIHTARPSLPYAAAVIWALIAVVVQNLGGAVSVAILAGIGAAGVAALAARSALGPRAA